MAAAIMPDDDDDDDLDDDTDSPVDGEEAEASA